MSGNLDHPFIGGVPGSGRSPAETEVLQEKCLVSPSGEEG